MLQPSLLSRFKLRQLACMGLVLMTPVVSGLSAENGSSTCFNRCLADDPAPAIDEPMAALERPEKVEATTPSATDQAGEGLKVQAAVSPTTPSPPPAELPSSFEILRPIHFFAGQASGIVPDSFRAVSIPQLDEKLTPLLASSSSVDDSPQLVRAVYVARLDGTSLISSQTTWDVTHQGKDASRLDLGPLGLAIRSVVVSGGGSSLPEDIPPLNTDVEGGVSLTVNRDTRFGIEWTAAGKETDREIDFDLEVPRAAQARWLIAIPSEMRLEAADGVVQSLPSPPPEASARDSGRSLSWYAIDGGGLSRLRLKVIKTLLGGGGAFVLVRNASLNYELLPESIRFQARIDFDLPSNGTVPLLRVEGGQLINVTSGGASLPWGETAGEGERWVRIDMADATASGAGPVGITLEGEASWDAVDGLQELPWIEFKDGLPELFGNQLPIKIVVPPTLDLMRLVLPGGWGYLPKSETAEENDSFAFLIGGPWGIDPPAVRVAPPGRPLSAESVLRLSASESRYHAILESELSFSGSGPSAVSLKVDAGWTVESIVIPKTGRVVELPPEFSTERLITIWPTSEELDDRLMRLRVVGFRPLQVDGDFTTYPASSFATFINCRNRLTGIASPPSGFRWTSQASLVNSRIEARELSDRQRELVGDVSEGSLLLDLSSVRMAALASTRPAAAFDSESMVRLDVDNRRVVETHIIRCKSPVGRLDDIRIEYSASDDPAMTWAVGPSTGGSRRLLTTNRMATTTFENAEEREIWDLELERNGDPEVVLIGRREQASTPIGTESIRPLRIELPSVVGARNQQAKVLVSPELRLTRVSDSVIRVPNVEMATGQEEFGSANEGIMLRYDSSGVNWVEVLPTVSEQSPTVVWSESVDIVSSKHTGDRINATYRLRPDEELTLHCDTDLKLLAITDRKGHSLSHEAEPGKLTVRAPHDPRASDNGYGTNPLGDLTEINVRWVRGADGRDMLRRWQAPNLRPACLVVQSDWRLLPSPDTFVPIAIVGNIPRKLIRLLGLDDTEARPGEAEPMEDPDSALGSALRLDPDRPTTVWMTDRSTWLGLSVAIGFAIFAGSWRLVRHRPALLGVTTLITCVLLPTLSLSWDWAMMVGVPLVAGGLLGTSRSVESERQVARATTSLAETARVIVWIAMIFTVRVAMAPNSLWGQSTELSSEEAATGPKAQGSTPPEGIGLSRERPVVLVPTGDDGKIQGDKVYIPQDLYQRLFRTSLIPTTKPLITSSSYRLRLSGMSETGSPSADWEVRYSLANLGERCEFVLPMPASQVRSVEWLPGGEVKPLRWAAEGEDGIRIFLPPTNMAALLVRLSTPVESPEPRLRRLRLPIPPVVNTSLFVDSNSAVQRLALKESIGQTVAQPESGRLSSDLGEVSVIDLEVLLRQGSRGIPVIGARRYWVHASPGAGQVECEIESAERSVQLGTDMPIVLLGGAAPVLTSPDWALERTEAISSQRLLLTLRAKRDQPGPIRLLWSIRPIVAAMAETDDSVAITIPEVISAGSAPTPEALIATSAGTGYELVPFGDFDAASGSKDLAQAFIAAWKGYQGVAQDVFASDTPIRLLLVQMPTRPWRCEELHHLHIRADEALLNYSCQLTRGDTPLGPLRLTLPAKYEVRSLTVNRTDVLKSGRTAGGVTEFLIPDRLVDDRTEIRLTAVKTLLLTEPFEPPRTRIEPIIQVSGTYTLTRDQGLRIEQIRSGELAEISQPPMKVGDQLLGRWIPCWTWRIEEGQFPDSMPAPQADRPVFLGGSFRAEAITTRIEVLQRAGVIWSTDRWMADSVIRIRAVGPDGESQPLLDDLDVQWPAAWGEKLEIEPVEAWSSQPSIDPSMMVIRIRPDSEARSIGNATIRVRGFRSGENESLPNIPRPEVLGASSENSYLVVPKSAAGNQLTWSSLSAVPATLPPELDDNNIDPPSLAQVPSDPSSPPPLVFRTLDTGANVRLQPSRNETFVAQASIADIQVFPKDANHLLVMQRWDINPGGASSITINLNAEIRPIAAWAAEQEIPLPGRQDPNELSIPLQLTGLPHSVVLLCEIKKLNALDSAPLPTLKGVDVGTTWLSIFRGPNFGAHSQLRLSSRETGWQTASDDDRLMAMAESILSVTQTPATGATDRTTDELVAWLTPWNRRIRALRSTALEEAAMGTPERDPNKSSAGQSEKAAAWELLAQRWDQYSTRITAGLLAEGSPEAEPASEGNQPRVALVAKHGGKVDRLPLTEFGRTTQAQGLGIVSIAMLGLTAFVCWLAWRSRAEVERLCKDPRVWLFALGLVSMAILPVFMSIFLCLTPLASPIFAAHAKVQSRKARFGL